MRRFLAASAVLLFTAFPALAQNAITLPIAANAVADLGNGPIKVRMIAGNASIFTAQGSGTGSTSGSSTALTLTATPATPPLVGGLISGSGITSGTTVAAYNGTTGVTLSAAMTVAGGTTVSWGAACPSTPPSSVIQASPSADGYVMYTQARVCAVSPGGPVNTLLISPVFQDSQGGSGSGNVNGPATSIVGGVAVWKNGAGTLLADGATDDGFFGSGRPWADIRAYGAKGDGATDDTAAITAAYNQLAAIGGGDLFFPPAPNGLYCTFTGITISNGNVHLRFAANGAASNGISSLSSCGHDVTTLNLNAGSIILDYANIIGDGYGATHPALDFGPSCGGCKMHFGSVSGGTSPVLIEGVDDRIENVNVAPGYGTASIKIINGATYLDHVSADLSPPVYTLTNANFSGGAASWAATHAYSGSVTVSTQGFFIQLVTASCTSGGSAPTLKSYGTNITDGTCTWKLLSPGTYYSVQVDTGASAVYLNNGDSSGPFVAGVGVTNTSAGTAPGGITVENWNFGANLQAGIYAHDGNTLSVSDSTLNGCIYGGCAGIYTLGSWTGVVNASSNLIVGEQAGIDLTVGGGDTIVGNTIVANVTGVLVSNNYANFNINNNNFYNAAYGANSGNDITIGTGAIHCNVIGNSSNGGTFSTGACKAFANDGSVVSYTNGGTNATSLAGAQANLLIGTLMSVPATVNFAVAGDYAIAVPLPAGFTQFRADDIVISQCSVSLSGATFGLFTATGGGGAAIITAGATSNVTNNTANTNNNMQFGAGFINNIGTEAYTPVSGNVQFRVGSTAAGTCSVAFQYKPVP